MNKSDFRKSDVATMLIKLTILDANLKKEILDAQNPESKGGEKITREEREKINDAIKNIEDKKIYLYEFLQRLWCNNWEERIK